MWDSLWFTLFPSHKREGTSGKLQCWHILTLNYVSGVNICPTKSETVYRPIWGILKLSVVLNQNILKLSFRCIPYVPKPSITSRKFWNCPSELNISETQKLSIRNKNRKLSGVKTPDKWLLIHPRSCQKEFTSFLSIFLRIFRKKVKDYF